ncbi:MAG: nucleotidyltransferase family protein [Armatimonadota bacterium]
MSPHISIDSARIADFCRKNHIVKLALFGSVLRDDFRQDSDIDVLVWFAPGQRVTLFDMVDMEEELSQLLGRKVDLRTPEDLSRYFREQVVAQAEVQYAA